MPRVLVISPTDLASHLGRTVLWGSGVERSFASDEATGYEVARSWGPNLVVLDSGEPASTIRMARRLRDDPATRRTAIAAVSRDPFLADAEALRKAGANVVIPTDADPLVWDACLEELLSVQHRREAQFPARVETWSSAAGREDVIEGKAVNISVSGLLLESSPPLEVGLKLNLLFRIPGSDKDLRAIGEVVRRDDRSRSGIRFLMLRGDAREAIGAFVEGPTTPDVAPGSAAREAMSVEDEWEAALRASEALKSTILDASLDSIIVMTHEGRIVDINPTAERTFGFSRQQMAGRTLADTITPVSGGEPHRQALVQALVRGGTPLVGQRIEMTANRADGGEVPVELTLTATPVRGRRFYTAFFRDLSAAKRIERLQEASRRIAEASAASDDLESLCSAIHGIAAELTLAKTFFIALRDESSGLLTFPFFVEGGPTKPPGAKGPRALTDYVLRTGEPLLASDSIIAGLVARGEVECVGSTAGEWLVVPLKKHGDPFGVVAVQRHDPAVRFTDSDLNALTSLAQPVAVAIERKQAEARIYYLAYYDPLTGLPNRHLLLDRLQLAVAQAARDQNHLAVFFLGLDRFKVINDTLGHTVGDQVLKEAGARFLRHVRKGDTLARIGSDEFTVVVRGLRNPADAGKVAQTLQGALAEPLVIERELFVTTSIGISVFPEDGGDAETILKNAHTALYRAKEQGDESFRLYDPSMNEQAIEKLRLEHGLRRALSRDELVMYYQPVVDLASGEIHGVEALLRWHHPERGIVLPTEFIQLAETTGVIRSIGSWGLRAACAQASTWHEQGHPRLSVAVNLSARQLQNMNLVGEVTALLESFRLPAEFLELEITESSAMQNPAVTIRALEALKALGVRISIDDFGTGYSSLSQLQRLPIDTLKIDQSFVRDITADPSDAAIATAIINLGHTLKLNVVAEGVETADQLAFLTERNCDRIQGFLVTHPVPAQECTVLLSAHEARRWQTIRG